MKKPRPKAKKTAAKPKKTTPRAKRLTKPKKNDAKGEKADKAKKNDAKGEKADKAKKDDAKGEKADKAKKNDAKSEKADDKSAEAKPEKASSSDEKPADPGRRGFLFALGGIGALWAGASLYPVYKYLAPKPQKDPFADGKVPVEKVTLDEVKSPGMGKNGGYAGRGLIIYRAEDQGLRAFDSKCTHAGCNVSYEVDAFRCHCHGGVYDLNGINIGGPPPAPLTELRAFEEDGVLYVARMDSETEG